MSTVPEVLPQPFTPASVEDLKSKVGHELGVTGWHRVTQAEVNAFADVTGDHQWIHTDPVRARTGPFGGTIVHGYLTLALAPELLGEVISFDAFPIALNYGLDRLRFPAPLPVGESLRMSVTLDRVDEFQGGATMALTLTFERTGGDKPVCVANALYRVLSAVLP